MNKRPDITDATRQRFIDAFCTLYKMKPVEKITVKEIAALAGHNRVTFDQYFRDSFAVLESLENELLAHVQKAIERNIRSENMFSQFEQVFDSMLSENPKLVDILLTGANCSSTLDRCKNAMLPILMSAFHLDENNYKQRGVLEFYLSGVVALMKYAVDHSEKITTPEIGQIIKQFLQNGVLPQLDAYPCEG